MFDCLIIGGGVSGISAALILGSAAKKPFMEGKKIAVLTHQKASSLQNALFNNAYGIPSGTLGSALMVQSLEQLAENYPEIQQLANEKVLKLQKESSFWTVTTNKNSYEAKNVIVCIGSSQPFTIEGLENYILPHQKAAPEKNRIQLKNEDHKVCDGLYVAGTLAGHRSQLTIAAGSGASVATDILSMWNDNKPTQVHDSILK